MAVVEAFAEEPLEPVHRSGEIVGSEWCNRSFLLQHLEPHAALFVRGDDPLEVAARLGREAMEALRPGGLLAFEVGAGSAEGAVALLEGLGYGDVAVVPDLAGIDRVVSGRRP